MSKIVIKNARIVNEGKIIEGDMLVSGDRIERIDSSIDSDGKEINAEGLILMPGIVDDQVHFREPGLTYKADIASESRAAVSGGTTSFMEMPNTKPSCLTQELLQDKYDIAQKSAYCNYSFFMGASNDNIEEVLKTNRHDVCGLKVFMGSSTGNMLVDEPKTLENIFSQVDMLIATHCEDEATIRSNMAWYKDRFGQEIDAKEHGFIRSEEGCLLSSSMAIDMAEKYDTRLHILHISTAIETELFGNSKPLSEKRITSEVCVHHLHFEASQYEQLGNKIKCNPAIKEGYNKKELWRALLDDRLDIIATDHAPHTQEEKSKHYLEAPSGLPLVQHSLDIMMHHYQKGDISLERIIEKMCHAPSVCFNLRERGFLREGYFADFVIYDPQHEWTVSKDNILYKCAWSPLEGRKLKGRVKSTYVNGKEVYNCSAQTFVQGQGTRLKFH